jgi:hypothetical protein
MRGNRAPREGLPRWMIAVIIVVVLALIVSRVFR